MRKDYSYKETYPSVMRSKIVINWVMCLVMMTILFVVLSCEEEPLTVSKTSPKAITGFKFENSANTMLSKDIVGDVSEGNKTIRVTVPYNKKIRDLVPTITTSEGASVSPASGEKVDFRSLVHYVITGSDGTTDSYRIILAPYFPSAKTSLSVKYGGANIVSRGQNDFLVILPASASLKEVELTLTASGDASLAEDGTDVALEKNAVTKKVDFSTSSSKAFTVTAENGVDKKDYTVTVAKKENTSNKILAFLLLPVNNPSLGGSMVEGVIDQDAKSITLDLPAGTNVEELIPTVMHTGEGTSPKNKEEQNFENAVEYTVTAENGSENQYTVASTVELYKGANLSIKFLYPAKPDDDENEEKSISALNSEFLIVLPIHVKENSVQLALTVSKKATLSEGATSIPVESNSVTRGFDFSASSSKTFTVTPEDGESKDYVVKVVPRSASTKQIVSFVFYGNDNPYFNDKGLALQGTIDKQANTIAVTFPKWTNLASLVPVIKYSGESVSPDSKKSTDFRIVFNADGSENTEKRVTYTVKAKDKSETKYTVIVMETL